MERGKLTALYGALTPDQRAEVAQYKNALEDGRSKMLSKMSNAALAYINAEYPADTPVSTGVIRIPTIIPSDLAARSEDRASGTPVAPEMFAKGPRIAQPTVDQRKAENMGAALVRRIKNSRRLTKGEKRLLVGCIGLFGIAFIIVLAHAGADGSRGYATIPPSATRTATLTLTPTQVEEMLAGTPLAALVKGTDTPIPTDTAVPTPVSTESPTPSETSTPALTPTQTEPPTVTAHPRTEKTPTKTQTPHSRATTTTAPSRTPTPTRTPTSTPTETRTVTPTAVPGVPESSYLTQPDPENDLGVNRDGVTKIEDVEKFQQYLRSAIQRGGRLSNGGIDFVAQQMSAGIGPDTFTDHSPNYWIKNGLGFIGNENFFGSEMGLRGSLANGAFTMGNDGIGRLFGLTTIKDFENFTALAAISAKLQASSMVGKPEDQIRKFLEKPEVDADIKRMTYEAIASSGYKGKDPTKGVVSWPGAATLYAGDANFVPDSGTTCITYMGDAPTRTQQTEKVEPVEFDLGLEKKTPGNDEAPNLRDSEDTLIVSVLFASTPDGKVQFRADYFSSATVPDQNPKAPLFVFPKDDDAETQPTENGRLIPCGSGRRGEAPVVQPGRPGNQVTPPPGETLPPQNSTPTPKTTDVATNVPPATWTPVAGKPTDVRYPTVIPTEVPRTSVPPATAVPASSTPSVQ